MTSCSLLPSNGTMSSTRDFGVLPSGVTPVAQFWSRDKKGCISPVSADLMTRSRSRREKATNLLDHSNIRQLLLFKDVHTCLSHCQVEGELKTNKQSIKQKGDVSGRRTCWGKDVKLSDKKKSEKVVPFHASPDTAADSLACPSSHSN